MKLTSLKSLFLMAGILLSFVVTSCSKDQSELLGTVPADVTWVQTLDLKKLLTDAGCTFSGNEVQLTPQISRLLDNDAELLSVISSLSTAIDMEHIVLFGDANVPAICTFMITDHEAFTSCIESSSLESDEGSDGYDLYTGYLRTALVVKDNQGWVMQTSSPVKKVKNISESAADASIMSLDGILDFLRGSNIANIAIAKTGMMLGTQTDSWTCIDVDIESNILAANIVNMEADGKVIPVETLQTINTDFLRYVPSDFTLAFAAGLTDDINWNSAATTATMVGGYRLRGFFDTLIPFLKQIDGTVSFAAGARTPDVWYNPTLNNAGFIFMAHMPQDAVDDALRTIAQFAGQAGISVTTEQPSGQLVANINGATLRAGNVDGCLTLANIPIEPTHSNSLNTDFLSKKAALSFTIPELSQLTRGADFGVKFTAGVESERIHARLSLIGTDDPILEKLLSLMAR